MWRTIQAEQKQNPPTSSCGEFVVIPTQSSGQLFLGSAFAAEDRAFLNEKRISCVIALGTGNLTSLQDVLCIDIIDVQEALILGYFDICIGYLHERLEQGRNVLVHCAYGQSRSAAICVAYLMQQEKYSLLDGYKVVQQARPCIYINSGFLEQLDLYEQMGCSLDGDSSAHATYRTMQALQNKRSQDQNVELYTSKLALATNKIYCRKCNYLLCTSNNMVMHEHLNGTCDAVFLEPLSWMELSGEQGRLSCPRCKGKLGIYNWFGLKCSLGTFQQPVFQLSRARVDMRKV
ncbi:hypothetical protein THRCLA_20525 [Thraustotheca clavata]|uniref:protein-tyrosine-phosphatase n=1 Tax=Thraustotheca clavata TaxID=74557 RepID=A0A1W0A6A4_9STRA|nr:hypothetical protein THRCLA_20525 [Thraustotheca clavata]